LENGDAGRCGGGQRAGEILLADGMASWWQIAGLGSKSQSETIVGNFGGGRSNLLF